MKYTTKSTNPKVGQTVTVTVKSDDGKRRRVSCEVYAVHRSLGTWAAVDRHFNFYYFSL